MPCNGKSHPLVDKFKTLPHSLNQSWQVEGQGAVPESSIVQQMLLLLALVSLRLESPKMAKLVSMLC